MSKLNGADVGLIAGAVLLLVAAVVGYIAINRITDPEYVGLDRWVFCDFPRGAIVYKEPSLESEVIGRIQLMKHVRLTGKQKNGFVQVENYGWVPGNLFVEDRPENMHGDWHQVVGAKQVPCRVMIGTAPVNYLDRGTYVQVFLKSREWSLTSRGIISSKNLVKRTEMP